MSNVSKPEKYRAYIQWLECECGRKRHGIVRVFKAPFGKILDNGEPAKKYRWLCHFDMQGDTIKMQGTMRSPSIDAKIACIALARDLGCSNLIWQRSTGSALISRRFRIAKTST